MNNQSQTLQLSPDPANCKAFILKGLYSHSTINTAAVKFLLVTLTAAANVLQWQFNYLPADLRFGEIILILVTRTFLSEVAWQTSRSWS